MPTIINITSSEENDDVRRKGWDNGNHHSSRSSNYDLHHHHEQQQQWPPRIFQRYWFHIDKHPQVWKAITTNNNQSDEPAIIWQLVRQHENQGIKRKEIKKVGDGSEILPIHLAKRPSELLHNSLHTLHSVCKLDFQDYTYIYQFLVTMHTA